MGIAMEMVILIGIQASGKSSFYRACFFDTHVRISLDLLRTRHRQRRLMQLCLETRQAFVLDNTNVTAAERALAITPAREAGFTVTGYCFVPRLNESLARNRLRTGKALIPDKGVIGTYTRFECPRRHEGFDRLFKVALGSGDFITQEWDDEI